MKKLHTAALVLGLAGFALSPAASAFTQERHDEQRDQRDEHHDRAEYHFRQEDGAKLRQHYNRIDHVDVHHRPEYVTGGHLPSDWRKRIHPVPEAVVRELPPPPRGYVFGYMDGYAVVYDPRALVIADVIDLTNLRR